MTERDCKIDALVERAKSIMRDKPPRAFLLTWDIVMDLAELDDLRDRMLIGINNVGNLDEVINGDVK